MDIVYWLEEESPSVSFIRFSSGDLHTFIEYASEVLQLLNVRSAE